MSTKSNPSVKNKNQPNTKPDSQLPEPSYLPQVVKKLRKHPEYQDQKFTDEEWKEQARKVTDPSELHVYFSHLTDDAYGDCAVETRDEAEMTGSGTTLHEDEEKFARDRARSRLDKMSTLPVMLLLRECRDSPPSPLMSKFATIFRMKFGPLHAALQVGNILVDWDDTSLIIPQWGDFRNAVFKSDIGHETSASASVTQLAPLMATAVNDLNFNNQINLLFDISVSRKKMIDDLIRVIATYNKLYTYHVLSRNCQTFVSDAMKAMGIKNAPKFTGKLSAYFTDLKKGKTESIPNDFPTHQDLDRYVMSVIQDKTELTQHDKEYLLCMYFQFHLQTMRKAKDPDEGCHTSTCQMGKLEKMIDGQHMILEDYN